MKKNVLSVGQCEFDHSSISAVISTFEAVTIKVNLHSEVMAAISKFKPVLILINRINDSDGSSGIDLIKELSDSVEAKKIPKILISNYPEAQVEAMQHGAMKGFGKQELLSLKTKNILKAFL